MLKEFRGGDLYSVVYTGESKGAIYSSSLNIFIEIINVTKSINECYWNGIRQSLGWSLLLHESLGCLPILWLLGEGNIVRTSL